VAVAIEQVLEAGHFFHVGGQYLAIMRLGFVERFDPVGQCFSLTFAPARTRNGFVSIFMRAVLIIPPRSMRNVHRPIRGLRFAFRRPIT
jgi:hypothetical protein